MLSKHESIEEIGLRYQAVYLRKHARVHGYRNMMDLLINAPALMETLSKSFRLWINNKVVE